MSQTKDQQLFHFQNILETLQEASQHFTDLVKKHGLNQALYIANYFASVNEDMVSEMIVTLVIDEKQNATFQDIDLAGTVSAVIRDQQLHKQPLIMQHHSYKSFISKSRFADFANRLFYTT